MERMAFDLLFRRFASLGVDDAAWDHSSVTKNRDRLLEGETAAKVLRGASPAPGQAADLLPFSVDGTLIEAWASLKSFRRKDGSGSDSEGPGRNAERGFRKETHSNATHQSTTDPQARLQRPRSSQIAELDGSSPRVRRTH